MGRQHARRWSLCCFKRHCAFRVFTEGSRALHSSAYGQWGKIMLELVQQESNGASPFRDLYSEANRASTMAVMVDDMAVAVRHFEEADIPRHKGVTLSGVEFAFDATTSLGHYIEVYEAGDAVKGFYEYVESLSKQPWDTKHLWAVNTQIKVTACESEVGSRFPNFSSCFAD